MTQHHPENPAARADEAVVLGPGEGPALWFLANRMVLKALPEHTGGGFSMYESQLPPGFSPPLHVHRREATAFRRRTPRRSPGCAPPLQDSASS